MTSVSFETQRGERVPPRNSPAASMPPRSAPKTWKAIVRGAQEPAAQLTTEPKPKPGSAKSMAAPANAKGARRDEGARGRPPRKAVVAAVPKPPAEEQSRRARPTWCRATAPKYAFTLGDLGREIKDFAKHVSLTPHETEIRRGIVEQLREVVRLALDDPNVECVVFGSFSFGLSLASSDVDLAIKLADSTYSAREILAHVLEFIDPMQFSAIPVYNAVVPVLKLCHIASGVHVDVSLATEDTCLSVATQLAFQQEFPYAEPLILVVKTLLRQWGLGSVVDGGLSSTGLYLLVERFLSAEPEPGSITWARKLIPTIPATPSGVSIVSGPSRPATPNSIDAEWKGGSAECPSASAGSTGSSADEMASSTSPSSTVGQRRLTSNKELGQLFIALLAHFSNDAYQRGFALFDRLDATNEVTRSTTRTAEISVYMNHSRTVLNQLLDADCTTNEPPVASLLSAVASDPRRAPNPAVSSSMMSVRIGGHPIRS